MSNYPTRWLSFIYLKTSLPISNYVDSKSGLPSLWKASRNQILRLISIQKYQPKVLNKSSGIVSKHLRISRRIKKKKRKGKTHIKTPPWDSDSAALGRASTSILKKKKSKKQAKPHTTPKLFLICNSGMTWKPVPFSQTVWWLLFSPLPAVQPWAWTNYLIRLCL